VARPIAALLAATAVVLLPSAEGRAVAAETPVAGPLRVDAERVAGGGGERLRVSITGVAPDGARSSVVRVSTADPAAGCAAGGRRAVGWRRLSPLRPGSRIDAGRAFAIVGTVAVPSGGAVRLCVVQRRGGRTVERATTVVEARLSGFLDPILGRSLAAALDPVVRVVGPLLLALALLLLGRRAAAVVRERRRREASRRAAVARQVSQPHRTSSIITPGHGSEDPFAALPPLPSGLVVPDAPPVELLAGVVPAPPEDVPEPEAPAAAAEVDLAEEPLDVADDAPAGPRGRLRRPARARERRWVLERTLAPLGRAVDEIVLLEPATGDAALVVARRQRLAFVVLLAEDAVTDEERDRLARLARDARDARLAGLAPVPVLVTRHGTGPAVAGDAHADYPGLQTWTVAAGELARFVAARIPGRRTRSERHVRW